MDAKELLLEARIEVAREIYTLVSIDHKTWNSLLDRPELSPRMTAQFMILMDKWEVTLLLDEIDLEVLLPGLSNAKIERGYRLMTFDLVLDLGIVGFMAEISRLLAEANIPIMALSAFSRDHLLIKQQDLGKALKTLGEHVASIC
jgi:hypothetical protein